MAKKSFEKSPATNQGGFLHNETQPRVASAYVRQSREIYKEPEHNPLGSIDLSNPVEIEGLVVELAELSKQSLEFVYFKNLLIKNINDNLPKNYDSKALSNIVNSALNSYQKASELYGSVGLSMPPDKIADLFDSNSLDMLFEELDKRREATILFYPVIPVLEESAGEDKPSYQQLLKQAIADKPKLQNDLLFWLDDTKKHDVVDTANKSDIVWNMSVVSDGGLEESFDEDVHEYLAYQATMLSQHKFPSTTSAEWGCFADNDYRFSVYYTFDDKHQFNFEFHNKPRS
jgi:hypothetical protein